MISQAQLSAVCKNPDVWIDHINSVCDRYEINTKNRIAAFLSQVAHESSRFSVLEENLNYKAQGLLNIFPKYFTADGAKFYERNPQMIANKVYANRMGNGNEASGDGWKYRGRGLIQVTGKSNYKSCGNALGLLLVSSPDMLIEPEYACLSAGWYWDSCNVNKYADQGDIDGVSDMINRGRKTAAIGDSIGYADRVDLYNKMLAVL